MRSSEPVFQALWDTYNECQFVEDDGSFFAQKIRVSNLTLFLTLGDILFYRNKRGEGKRWGTHEVTTT